MADLFYMAMIMDYEIEIPFGAFDSELMRQEIFIPKGFEATIEGDKIILIRIESEDERIRKELIKYLKEGVEGYMPAGDRSDYQRWLAWLEKQGEHKPKKVSIWKHWKDGIAGGSEQEQIFLIKIGNIYSISSCLGCECDYIELSELDKLMREEGKSKWTEEDEKMLKEIISDVKFEGYNNDMQAKSYEKVEWLKELKQRMEK